MRTTKISLCDVILQDHNHAYGLLKLILLCVAGSSRLPQGAGVKRNKVNEIDHGSQMEGNIADSFI